VWLRAFPTSGDVATWYVIDAANQRLEAQLVLPGGESSAVTNEVCSYCSGTASMWKRLRCSTSCETSGSLWMPLDQESPGSSPGGATRSAMLV